MLSLHLQSEVELKSVKQAVVPLVVVPQTTEERTQVTPQTMPDLLQQGKQAQFTVSRFVPGLNENPP